MRGLARARQAGEPHHRRLLALLVGADRGGDARRLPHHVGAARAGRALRRDDHAGAHGAEVQQVDDDERARGAAQLVVVDGHRLFERDAHARQAVEIERLGLAGSQVVDVDAVLDRIDQALHVAAADLEFVALAGQQRRLAHPDEMRVEGARQRRAMIRVHQHVAARQVDLVFEHDGDGLLRARLVQRTVGGGDLAHLAASCATAAPAPRRPRQSRRWRWCRRSRGNSRPGGSRAGSGSAVP